MKDKYRLGRMVLSAYYQASKELSGEYREFIYDEKLFAILAWNQIKGSSAWKKLTKIEREQLTLYLYPHRKTLTEIARKYKVKPSTVYLNIQRAIKKLGLELKKLGLKDRESLITQGKGKITLKSIYKVVERLEKERD